MEDGERYYLFDLTYIFFILVGEEYFCPKNTSQITYTLMNITCLGYVHLKASWTLARDYCRNNLIPSAELVKISSQQENQLVQTIMKHYHWKYLWIGLNDKETEKKYDIILEQKKN